MQIAIISTGLATVLFLCAFLGFRQGLRLGLQTARGQMPPKLEPVKAIKDAITKPEPDQATTELLKGYANMMAFTGDLPPEEKR